MRKSSFLIIIFALFLVLPKISESQVIKPTGNTTEASSQLIYYYDQDGGITELQVTNVHDKESVWIHVQIFRNDDPDSDDSTPNVICDERNFIDMLTPNDTHVYEIEDDNFNKNVGETETDPGEATSISVTSTKGFVIITPVVSESDLTAIGFHNLIGNFVNESSGYIENAMGREAVDFATGQRVDDNTPLDGVTNGFVVLQPKELLYNLADAGSVDAVGITFKDNYGPQGLLGYQVTPGASSWTSFIFDYKEDPTSCGTLSVNCFSTVGINTDDFPQNNQEFLDGLLCDGTDLPTGTGYNGDYGWVRTFVSGLEDFETHLGFIFQSAGPGARWMNTNKDDINVQPVKTPTGITTRASSQLIYYYDQSDEGNNTGDSDDPFNGDSVIQVTNTDDTQPVTVHVQIFRSFNPDNDLTTANNVICDERNFIDVLTPNDTHIYDLGTSNFAKNIGETEALPGEDTSINVDDTKGFVVITPVVSESDLTAISFQHLIGETINLANGNVVDFILPAMGRDAVDLATGQLLNDNTPLNGVSNGFVLLQPEELLFDFVADSSSVDIVGVAFTDQYGPQGLLGYQVLPGATTWTTFNFDFNEDPTSCGSREDNCFLTVGLNDSIPQSNEELTDEDFLCPGSITPSGPIGDLVGWTRIFVSGIDEMENNIGFFISNVLDEDDFGGARNMFARGEREVIEPPVVEEDCAVEGDEDEDGFADCLDTDCATDESCETGEEECADEMDNDEDGQTDCADLGCDGFAGCEFGEEVSCDDGIDNDADGTVDGDDTDCQAADTEGTGGDGDGGGCVVTGTVSTSSSVVNFLVLMLPFIGVFGIRRIRKRK